MKVQTCEKNNNNNNNKSQIWSKGVSIQTRTSLSSLVRGCMLKTQHTVLMLFVRHVWFTLYHKLMLSEQISV